MKKMNPTEHSVCVSTARQSWLACISEPFAGDGTAQLVPVDVPLSFHPRGSGGTGARQASQVFLKPEVEVIVRGLGEP